MLPIFYLYDCQTYLKTNDIDYTSYFVLQFELEYDT